MAMANFVWKNIVYRFRVPEVLVIDNGTQFDGENFQSFYARVGICNHFSSPTHPQANGQVEVTNRTILQDLKKKLKRKKIEWVEEFLDVLIGYRTSVCTPSGQSAFSLVYGAEAILPVEIAIPTLRVKNYE